jgi:histidine triad (HIT) family protein
VGKLLRAAAKVAAQRGIDKRGWRAVMNVNREGGQIVFHVHLHVLGGRQMGWPPG